MALRIPDSIRKLELAAEWFPRQGLSPYYSASWSWPAQLSILEISDYSLSNPLGDARSSP
ncbi:hypothetical protein H9P43_000222 [Blastocladiella emersonii ATCC 22665]|nr:hypothetical protein H9P43_000222 [Blastocladiella emersonii ATCC 22665]